MKTSRDEQSHLEADRKSKANFSRLGIWKLFHHLFCFALWHRTIPLIFIFGFCLLLIFFLAPSLRMPSLLATDPPKDGIEWLSRAQGFIGVPTLMVAMLVWITQVYEDWKKSLPMRMSVFFFGPENSEEEGRRPVIVSRNVWLASEGDLRQWAMQVGSQAFTGFVYSKWEEDLKWQDDTKGTPPYDRNLDFAPGVFAETGKILVDHYGKAVKFFSIRFNLTKLPASLERAWSGAEEPQCLYQFLDHRQDTKSIELQSCSVTKIQSLKSALDWPQS